MQNENWVNYLQNWQQKIQGSIVTTTDFQKKDREKFKCYIHILRILNYHSLFLSLTIVFVLGSITINNAYAQVEIVAVGAVWIALLVLLVAAILAAGGLLALRNYCATIRAAYAAGTRPRPGTTDPATYAIWRTGIPWIVRWVC